MHPAPAPAQGSFQAYPKNGSIQKVNIKSVCSLGIIESQFSRPKLNNGKRGYLKKYYLRKEGT